MGLPGQEEDAPQGVEQRKLSRFEQQDRDIDRGETEAKYAHGEADNKCH